MTRILAVSPHLDDAVLSFGASLAQAAQDGAKVTVYTVFAGVAQPPYSPAAERMHSIWGISPDEDAVLHRQKEDIAALGHLGAGHVHGRFLDSIYRKAPDGRWLTDNVEGRQKLKIEKQAPESNRDLFIEVEDAIGSVVEEFAPTLIVTCAALSDHIDNEIARDASLAVANERGIPIRLWEDIPHATFGSGKVELPRAFRLGDPAFGSVKPEARTRKFQALELYPSQLAMFDGPEKNFFGALDEHAGKNSPDGGYGEVTWPVIFPEGDS
ncbi:PIG-L deacetylase family protein [Amycolatopsis sp. cmx-11-51]|uniref:PIG-L deacetylase family protein n=1 Tax=unclassified Amycolatopsis TaxID=2618356 RepID=UPI0039E70ABF